MRKVLAAALIVVIAASAALGAICLQLRNENKKLGKVKNELELKLAQKNIEDEKTIEKAQAYDAEKELRNSLDKQFTEIVQLLNSSSTEELTKRITNNIKADGNKLTSKIYNNELEFVLPDGDYILKKKYFGHNEDNACSLGYEMYGLNDELKLVFYVTFVLENGIWKMDGIQEI